ncbi:MAG: HAMP domain-containing sensor histidine kinase [Chlorobiaceae bacterium]
MIPHKDPIEGDIQLRSAELRAVNATLLNCHEQKISLFDIVVHDLRNPLNALILLAEFLEQHPDPAAVPSIARRISIMGHEMAALLSRFLEMSRIDSGTIQPQPQNFSLPEIVRSLAVQHQSSALRKRIHLEVHLPDGAGEILSDPQFMRVIIDNLISNAVKFSPSDTLVSIELDMNETGAYVSVVDQGPGLTAEDRKRLFQRFERLSARPTGGERSIGLGLSIVKNMVEVLGGHIWVDSEPGKGSAFRVMIPGHNSSGLASTNVGGLRL